MKIKNIFLSISILTVIALFTQSCDGMHDNYKEWLGERNYSGRVVALGATPGYERVVLTWINPTDQRSRSIRVVYGPDNTVINFPTLTGELSLDESIIEIEGVRYSLGQASIEGLVNAVGMDFTVFTVDAHGNLSVPTGISAIPVTQSLVNSLTPPAVVVRALGIDQFISFVGTSNVLMQFAGDIEFTLTNSDGVVVYTDNATMPELEGRADVDILLTDILPSGTYLMNYRMSVVPAMNGRPTADKVWLENNISLSVLPPRFNLMGIPITITAGSPGEGISTTGSISSNANRNPTAEHVGLLIDNNPGTKFLPQDRNNVTIIWEMNRAFAMNQMQITTANDGTDRDPRDWTLQGSNDGENWDILQTVVDWNPEGRTTRHRMFLIDVPLTQPYLYYKWDITRNWGSGTMVQIADWLLWYDTALTP
jgi:hypothetical protein